MSKKEQRQFVKELNASVMATMRERFARIPKEWTGIELRQYMADMFADSTYTMGRANKRKYNNDVLIHNL